ncbi:caspase domain-containing protein [Mycena leptocephala]|nr:caspase domain-containing protein [Mycena leptocephala]
MDDLPPLLGAVNDARAFERYLMDILHVPPANIAFIENEKATRSAILSTFKSHFLDNRNIPDHGETAMILYFAGHGSRVMVEGNLIAHNSKVEVMCPVDERTTNRAGWLLRELAEKKGPNITVILDCCHSGGMGRNTERARTARTSSRVIPPELDSHLWKGKADDIQSCRMWSPSATSHVLLAACRESETASEIKYDGTSHGHFTKHLVSLLQSTDLENTTYTELMNQIPKLHGQTPHCGGTRRNRLVFTGKYPVTGPHSVPLTPLNNSDFTNGSTLLQPKEPDSSQIFQVEMGSVEGVVPGTEFSAHTPNNTFICILEAQSVQVAHTILVAKRGTPLINIPRGSRAVVSDWKNEPMLLLVHIPTDFAYTAQLFPPTRTRRTLKYVQAPSLDQAHIVVRNDGDEIMIEPRTGTMRKCREKPIEGKFALEMHHLMGDYPQRKPDPRVGKDGNMVENGEVRFASEVGAKYGFTIRNASAEELFPYLFYFDPDAYTIHLLYEPAGARVMAPLLCENTVTIGMGSEAAFEFTLPVGEQCSSGLLKLFVSNVYIDLEWIQQEVSPFNPLFGGARKPHRALDALGPTWDALTVIVTMTAAQGD